MATPNEHCCYDKRDAEVLTLENPRKGWQGLPFAEICLLQIDARWISSLDVQLSNMGHGGPLSASGRSHATRAEALAHQIDRLIRFCAPSYPTDTQDADLRKKVSAWAEGLREPSQPDLFSFAALTSSPEASRRPATAA